MISAEGFTHVRRACRKTTDLFGERLIHKLLLSKAAGDGLGSQKKLKEK